MATKNNESANSAREKLKKAKTEEELNSILAEMNREYEQWESEQPPADDGPTIEELFPEDPGYAFKTYDAPTDFDIEHAAHEQYVPVAEGEKEKLRAKADAAKKDIELKEEKAVADAKTAQSNADDRLKADLAEIEDESIRNGMGRSSAKTLAEQKSDEDNKSAKAAISQQLSETLAVFDADKSALDSELQAAINKQDASTAAAIAKKIDELTQEREETLNEINTFNNKVKREIEEYRQMREQILHQAELDALEEEYAKEKYNYAFGYSGEKGESYRDRLALASEFYSQFDAKTAIEMIENNTYLRDYLGAYYNRLLEPFVNEYYGGE